MASLKNENHIVIYGFMINELHLKGNELILYAIIYGFTQDDKQWYYGSLSYLMSAIGCNSKTTVVNALQNLISKGLIIKESYESINGKASKYKYNNEVFVSFDGGIPKNGIGIPKFGMGIPKNGTNIYNIKENNNISDDILLQENTKKFVKPSIEEIKEYCEKRNNGVDAEKFYDFYTSNGWRVGKNPMKDWKAAVRTWERTPEYNKSNSYKQKCPEPKWFNKEIKQEEVKLTDEQRREFEEIKNGTYKP